MAKTSTSAKNIAGQATNQPLHGIKNGSIKKEKKPKFKNTPTGKVALVDNAKVENKKMTLQKSFQKNADVKKNQNLLKQKLKQLEEKENSPKGKKSSSKEKQNSPKGKQVQNKSLNKQDNKKSDLKSNKELEVDDSDSDDSNSDINEGFTSQEDISIQNKIFEDEDDDADVPDIFGASLAEDSDVDDEDFKDEGKEEDNDSDISDDEEMVENVDIRSNTRNVSKKFSKSNDDEDNEDDEDDDDDDDDSDENDNDIDMDEVIASLSDDENDENESKAPGLKALLEKSMTDDDDDDEDFNEEDEDEDEDDEDESENEDEDESESENEASDSKALLGKSMTDNDDDDEDFSEEDEDDEDDDISDEGGDDISNEEEEDDEKEDSVAKVVQKKVTKEKTTKTNLNDKDTSKTDKQVKMRKPLSPEEQEKIDKKTIFIDNIPKETKETTLKKVFGQYGPIDNVRFRSIIPKNLKTSKKVAAIKHDIHSKVHTVTVYICYKFEESAKKALCMNGKKFEGNYINVKIVAKSEHKEYNNKKSVFIANLKFGMNNTNPIWEHFGKCGEIESVRLIRDRKTGQTKGFGYVNFKSDNAAALALNLNGTEINNRPIRVSPYKENYITSEKPQKQRNREDGKKRFSPNRSNDNRPSKKFKKNSQEAVARSTENEANVKQKKPQKGNANPEEKMAKFFQGQKSDLKNKKKNKFNKKKKELAGKLTAKPKISKT